MAANRERPAGQDGQMQPRRAGSFGQLWYLDDHGQPAVARVHTGLTDGQMTEISGPNVREGMQVIAGIASSEPQTAVSSPFQSTQSRGSRRPGGF
jgi:HlyD family secretion protein